MKNGIILAVFVILSCAKGTGDESSIEFGRYLATLEELKLPAGRNLSYQSNTYDSALWLKFKHGNWTNFPCGKIHFGDSVIMTVEIGIGDFLWPSLMTFDQSGNRLDSLSPFVKSGLGMGYVSYENLLINERGEILVIDSTTTWAINSAGDDVVEGTEKLTVDTVKYRIDDNGRFKKNSPEP